MPFCFYEDTFYCEITKRRSDQNFSLKDTDLGSDNPKTSFTRYLLYRTVSEFSYVVAVFARFTVERFLKKNSMSSAFSV